MTIIRGAAQDVLATLPEHCHCNEGCGEPERCHAEGYGIEKYCLCSDVEA